MLLTMRGAGFTTALAVSLAAGAAWAQERPEPPSRTMPDGTIAGTVVDATSGLPLAGASVVITLEGDAILVTSVREPVWGQGYATRTDGDGQYRLVDVPFGRYALRVRRLGYKPVHLSVTLGRSEPFNVSVGLQVVPIRLEPEDISAPAAPFGATPASARLPDTRLAAHTFRNDHFLVNDTWVLTRGDVLEAVTLGETDLFRAIHRLPGVTTRDDFTAELWTRGAPWSHTRVYFDGLPLFNPVHTSGVFTGVNPDAVGAVFFHPGVRSASIGEGAAAVLDLQSRPARAERWSAAAELSAVSARATVDRRFADGRGSFMLAGRRSYIDLLMGALASVRRDSTLRVPYAFVDGAMRLTVPVGSTSTLEASGLFESDAVRGDVRQILRDTEGSWGNRAGRVTFATPLGNLWSRTTVGTSRFRGSLDLVDFAGPFDEVPFHTRLINQLDWTTVESSVASEGRLGVPGWAVGAQFVAQSQFYDGPTPRPYPTESIPDSLQFSADRASLALWAETRWPVVPDFSVELGLRAELGDSALLAPAATLSPRIAARWSVAGGAAALSGGWSRSYQFTQTVAPAGPGIGPDLHLTDVWVLADINTPAIRSDVWTLGAEGWLEDDWLGAVNLYAREALGATVPDPRPGLYTSTRPDFVPGINRAWGAEFSVRKLVGRWTGSAAFSWGISVIDAEGFTYPSPADRRAALDLTALMHITDQLRIGGAFSASSGAPFTRFILRTLPCDSLAGPCPPPAGALMIEEPNAERAPVYTTLDLLFDWHRAFPTWELGVFVQLRNALNRRNTVTYAGSLGGCEAPPPDAIAVRTRSGICDLFDRGLPLLPLAGVTVAF